MNRRIRIRVALLAAWTVLAACFASHAQTPPANLSPDTQEIVNLTHAHMTDDVLVAFIKNSGKVYNLSGDDMIYLSNQGVSQPVISALLQTSGGKPAPVAVPPPAPVAPPPGFADNFAGEASLNPALWMVQTPLVQSLAQWNGSVSMPPLLAFSPLGMQMSGVNGPGQFTGIQSAASYVAPFTLTTTVSGLAPEGIPFDVYLVSPDLRQWLSVAGHLGGAGGPAGGVGVSTPFGGLKIPLGHGPSPDYGVWVNWTASTQPISALGSKIYPFPAPSVPYIISITIGADGLASVFLQDTTGRTLGSLNAMPVGTGPFNVVLAGRRFGPTFANWNSVQLTSQQPAVAVAGPPEAPTLDYFQAHLSPYGQWVDVPGVGLSWIPAEANNYGWRPYMDSGHWEMTDAGWYWQSDYPWGDMAFHYGRWIKNEFTADRWAWVPGYDWAPSWVSWREGAGGLGWAPLPWGVEFRVGSGLYWHGALMVDGVGLGLGFDAYVFVGTDHFWEHDYHTYVFDRTRARDFYEHSQFHAGYKMEGGHLMAEGLGREHMREITHHEVVEHKASELRKTEVQKNFAKRTVEHKELAHPAEHPKPTARAETREHTTGTTPERKGATNSHPGSAAPKGHPSPTIGGAKGTSSPSSTNGPGSKPHG